MNYGGMLSLPTRECGLKSHYHTLLHHIYRHSLRGSVDWNWKAASAVSLLAVTPYAGVWIEIAWFLLQYQAICVTPYAGVWIEIEKLQVLFRCLQSLPTRECGLKFVKCQKWSEQVLVTPYAGVWIEITEYGGGYRGTKSLPTRECGLKLAWMHRLGLMQRHSLRGSVDWNFTHS